MATVTLQWPDYLILAAFLAISLGIGVYHSLTGGRQRTTQEFLMGNRRLSILPTAISLFVSFQSAIMVLGMTAEMYLYGVMFLVWAPIGFLLAAVITERLTVPWIYPLKLVSVYDYLERRYESKSVRILGALTGVVGAILYIGVAMYAPSAALESATGFPTTVSIPLMASVSIAYTALGGMRAVIWTDVFQFGTMVGGMLAIMIKGISVVGGLSKVFEICGEEGRLVATNWSLDPTVRHTCWGFIIGFTVNWAQTYGLNQSSVQRYSATESLRKARITMLLNVPALWISYVVACLTGLTVFAYFSTVRCDPLANNYITSPNQLLSLFVMTIFSNAPGFAGLFLATLYGGALSSVSSYLSGAAANCWDDILKKTRLSKLPEQWQALINRLLVVVFGVIATFVAFTAAFLPGHVTQVAITFGSTVYGPVLGVFIIGGISRHANWKGALIGASFGLVLNFWLSIGAFRLPVRHPTLPPTSVDGCSAVNDTWSTFNVSGLLLLQDDVTTSGFHMQSSSTLSPIAELTGLARFYAVSYLWYNVFGMLNSALVGLAASLIFRDKTAEAKIDSCLLIPFRQCLSWSDTADKRPSSGQQHSTEYIAVDTINVDKMHGSTVEVR